MRNKSFCIISIVFLLCVCLWGCDENQPLQLTDITLLNTTVQTTLPDDVLAAMKIQADDMSGWVHHTLARDDMLEETLILQNQLIAYGLDKTDFHELQKAFYTQYIDAGV